MRRLVIISVIFIIFLTIIVVVTGCEKGDKARALEDLSLKVDFYPGTADLQRAVANASKYVWAKTIRGKIISDADWWVKKSDDFIRDWIPELTPFRAINCPEGHLWRYNWEWDKDKPDQVICKTCGKTFYAKDFPEQDKELLTNPITAQYRWDNDPRIQGNIRGLVRYHKMNWVENSIHTLGLAYGFTGNKKYAEKAVVMLERLAEVYDGWIVHDWTYMYPADSPKGYAGKSSGWKIYDAQLLKNAAITYNYIYGSGLLTDEQKRLIEDKFFRVGVRLLTALPPESALTNGAPQLLVGTATLGRILEEHDIIAYTVEGFKGLLKKYFLEDGHWWESSPSYALMALNDFYLIPEILQGYTDPVDYIGEDAFKDLDIKGDPSIKKIFTALNDITFPDGTLPAINDSHVGARVSPALAEALYSWYGGEENLALLNEAYNGNLKMNGNEYAFFKRPVDIEVPSKSEVSSGIQKSYVAPGLGLGILRAGQPKNQTVLMIDFGPHGGGHGHPDKLNILFWANGNELLTDLGYIHAGDPLMKWIRSSVSHNLVVVDLKEQSQTTGQLRTFATSPGVQVITAEAPGAYMYQGTGVTLYNRTCALVGLPEEDIYGVDIFRVKGGRIHDWIMHSPNKGSNTTCRGVELKDGELPYKIGGYTYLDEIRAGKTEGAWGFEWDFWKMKVDVLNDEEMGVYVATAPGQREFSGSDKGARISVIIGRRTGTDLSSQFISILQPYNKEPFIKDIKRLPFTESQKMRAGIRVELIDQVDYILSTLEETPYEEHSIETGTTGTISFAGEFGICSFNGNELNYLFLANGKKIEGATHGIEGEENLNGIWLKRLNEKAYELQGQGKVRVRLPKVSSEIGIVKDGVWTPLVPVEENAEAVVLEVSISEGEDIGIEFR